MIPPDAHLPTGDPGTLTPFAFDRAPQEREDREVRLMTVLDAVLRDARMSLAVSLASRAAA
ncbi:hypothetical protein GTW46_00215 [Streptomyces sp. SID6013]|nr:hypothetical protein NI25_01685 [Streptomyces sp. CCM_MD2014]MYS48510.1 hypothetical protein [Streptomyces sp. SID6013]